MKRPVLFTPTDPAAGGAPEGGLLRTGHNRADDASLAVSATLTCNSLITRCGTFNALSFQSVPSGG
jgi:hypothetical protein